MRKPVSYSSFYEFVESMAHQFGPRNALVSQNKETWNEISYEQLFKNSVELARFLKLKGVRPGERVAILSESRTEYPQMVFGIVMAGAVAVPIDAKLSPYEVSNIMEHSEPKAVLVSDQLWETFCNAQADSGQVFSFFKIDGGEESLGLQKISTPKTIEVSPRDVDETALIIYTSGTSGAPKGVMVKASTLLFEVEQVGHVSYDSNYRTTLSILPMNHLFEFTAGVLGNLSFGVEICVARNLEKDHLMYCLSEKKVTHMCAVPLFLKSIKDGIEAKVAAAGFVKQTLFRVLSFLSALVPVPAFRKMIFSEVRKGLGGSLFCFVSGGAPLNKEVAEFYNKLGIEIYEGYGLSETGPIITANRKDAVCIGSAGQKIGGIQVKIESPDESNQGEILTRGPHVMKGYYKNEDLTKEVIDDEGWFKTGDIGFVDKNGFLFITGRKKRMIVLEGGKKVMAEEVEDVLARCPEILEVCVMGSSKLSGQIGGREEVVAAVVPSESLKEEFSADPDALKPYMVKVVQQATQVLTGFKRPTQVVVVLTELPKTTTMKVKINETAELVNQHLSADGR